MTEKEILTDIQKNIIELMKHNPLKKYGRVCYVGDKNFNANSVKSLIKKGIIQFYVHDKANGWDFYILSDSDLATQPPKP